VSLDGGFARDPDPVPKSTAVLCRETVPLKVGSPGYPSRTAAHRDGAVT